MSQEQTKEIKKLLLYSHLKNSTKGDVVWNRRENKLENRLKGKIPSMSGFFKINTNPMRDFLLKVRIFTSVHTSCCLMF